MKDESLLQFPCDFPIKVMGVGDAGFQTLVMELVRRRAPDLDDPALQAELERAIPNAVQMGDPVLVNGPLAV